MPISTRQSEPEAFTSAASAVTQNGTYWRFTDENPPVTRRHR